jgi:putative flippase GtrA
VRRLTLASSAQFTRFLIVGAANTALSYAVYALGLALGLSYQLASLFAIVGGIAVGFITHGVLVFRQRLAGRLPFFLGLWCLLYLANITLIGALSFAGLNHYIAGLVAAVPITGLAYLLQKRVVFAEQTPQPWELVAGWLVAIVAVARLDLILRHELNWDEFLNLSMIYSHARGELTEVLQTAFVHLLWWAPYVSPNEVDQIIAARLLMLMFVVASSAAIFGITRVLADRFGALVAVLAWNAFTCTMLHGSALRTDTIATTAMLWAIWFTLARRPGIASSLAIGAFTGIGAALTIKAMFNVPTLGALLLIRLVDKGDGARTIGLILLSAGAAVGSFLAILTLHATTFPSVASPFAFVARTSGATLFSGSYAILITYLPTIVIRNVGFWLFTVAGVVGACQLTRRPEVRRQGLELLSFALPLLAFGIYRDFYPYFFPFILAPVAVLAGFGAMRMPLMIRAPGLILIAASALSAYWQGLSHGNSHQRSVLAEIHKLFPKPVPYVDHTSMVASYPKQGFFMSSWGMTDYRRRATPVMPDIVARQQPKFILATRPLLDVEGLDPATSQKSPRGLLAEDVRTLQKNYVRYWGPIFLPGLRLDGAGILNVHIEGAYRLEQGRSVELAGRMINRGEIIRLGAGNYRFRATEPAILRWAVPAPPSSTPPERLFDGF